MRMLHNDPNWYLAFVHKTPGCCVMTLIGIYGVAFAHKPPGCYIMMLIGI